MYEMRWSGLRRVIDREELMRLLVIEWNHAYWEAEDIVKRLDSGGSYSSGLAVIRAVEAMERG